MKPIDDPSKVTTPRDGYVPPNDFERIILGKLSGETAIQPDSRKPVPATTPSAVFSGSGGDAGFLIH